MEMEQLGGKIKKVGATSPLSHGLAYADKLDKIMVLDIAVFLDHWKKHSMRKLDLYNQFLHSSSEFTMNELN